MFNFSVRNLFVYLMCIALVVVGGYAANFYDSGLSGSPEHWGQLGDYFGGVLNPILGFTTIFILIATMGIQSEQLKASKEELFLTREELKRAAEAAIRQTRHFEREAKLKEYLILIDKLVGRINSNFNENRLDGQKSLHGFVNSFLDTRRSSYAGEVIGFWTSPDSSATKRVVGWVESDLTRLSVLITKYESAFNDGGDGGESGSPIPSFYQEEFGEMVGILFAHGMLNENLKAFFAPEKI